MTPRTITLNGVTVDLAAAKAAIAAAEAEAAKPQPVEGRIYRERARTNESPFLNGSALWRFQDGKWAGQYSAGGNWLACGATCGVCDEAFREGRYVPYTPPFVPLAVGTRVKLVEDHRAAAKSPSTAPAARKGARGVVVRYDSANEDAATSPYHGGYYVKFDKDGNHWWINRSAVALDPNPPQAGVDYQTPLKLHTSRYENGVWLEYDTRGNRLSVAHDHIESKWQRGELTPKQPLALRPGTILKDKVTGEVRRVGAVCNASHYFYIRLDGTADEMSKSSRIFPTDATHTILARYTVEGVRA